jgi:hypothetical protein
MAFAEEPLPKIFKDIILHIENNNGKITSVEFKQLLYSLRIEKQDINDIKNWLEKQGYINTIRGNGKQKGIIELTRTTTIF